MIKANINDKDLLQDFFEAMFDDISYSCKIVGHIHTDLGFVDGVITTATYSTQDNWLVIKHYSETTEDWEKRVREECDAHTDEGFWSERWSVEGGYMYKYYFNDMEG